MKTMNTLSKSPFTSSFLKNSTKRYGKIGTYWASLILYTGCYVSTKHRWLAIKIGSSGTGKTISDKVALASFGSQHNPLTITGRITPAGLAKLIKRSKNDEDSEMFLKQMKDTGLLFVEDLSRCNTRYLKVTSLQLLAGLTKNTKLDDLTSEGGVPEFSLGNEPKKCMISGTPSDWEELSSTSVYNEFVDRRSLTAIALMSSPEWNYRVALAKDSVMMKPDWQIEKEWEGIVKDSELLLYKGPIREVNFGEHRLKLYEKLSQFKRFPENVFFMIDSLAEGHARINGRNTVYPEDYEVVDRLFSRFILLSDMKKKELFIVEELIKNGGEMKVNDLIYKLRQKAKGNDLPELDLVARTISNYADMSKYFNRNVAYRNNPVLISISESLAVLLDEWDTYVKGILEE